MPIRFKKNESFYIRDGWFEKAINAIDENRKNIFYKNDGITILGIGSNMVKSLKYWMQAANIITADTSSKLTDLGKLLYRFDRYLDTKFSWFLIHYYLVKNKEQCPIFNLVFNSSLKQFTKNQIMQFLEEEIKQEGEVINKKYIEEDLNVFLKSYVNDSYESNPEENYACPLSSLILLKTDSRTYLKNAPRYSALPVAIIFYVLCDIYKNKPFIIEDSINAENSPCKVFNLEKTIYLQYLDEMKRMNLITINKTAGLNSVYFEKNWTLADLFEEYFGR